MKTSLCLGSALGILLCTSSAFAAIETYKVTLNGAQEVPAVTTTATGTGTLTLDTDTNELTGTITLVKGASGLADITGAHIHEALCGANKADPAFDLADGIDELTINVDGQLEDADVTKLKAKQFYVNIHSTAHTGGEIRGQIVLEADAATFVCPAALADAGSSGTSGGGGTSGGDGTSGGSDGTSGSTTGTSGSTSGAAKPAEDDGCSTSGSAPGGGLALALGVGLAVAAISRKRKQA